MDTYLRGAVQALQQDGSDWVAASLALNFDAALNEPHQSIGGFALSEVDQACSRAGLAGSWHGVFACHLRAFASIQQKRFVESYGYHMEMLQHFYEILETETNWLTPAMHVVVRDTRFLSIAADREGLRAGETKDEKIREAERMLKTAFKLCITDRQGPETSKKSGCVIFVEWRGWGCGCGGDRRRRAVLSVARAVLVCELCVRARVCVSVYVRVMTRTSWFVSACSSCCGLKPTIVGRGYVDYHQPYVGLPSPIVF